MTRRSPAVRRVQRSLAGVVLLVAYRDLNGNGMPDPGEITAEFEYFRLRCG